MVAISGTVIRLLSAAGQTTVVALGYLLAAEDFELVGAAPAPKVDPLGLLETLPEKVVQAARTWERHLIEVDTGVAPDAPEGTLPRPEYDPVTHSLAARQRAKAVELTAAGTRTSVRTVERMRQRYREQGLWGLVDTRYARAVKPAGNVDARVVAAAAGGRGADGDVDGHEVAGDLLPVTGSVVGREVHLRGGDDAAAGGEQAGPALRRDHGEPPG